MKSEKKQTLLIGMLILLPFTLLACVTFLLFSSYREMDQSFKWVAHSQEVHTRIQNLLKLLLDAETGQRGYLLTGRGPYLEPYQSTSETINNEFNLLRHLTRDNPVQQEILSRLEIPMQLRLSLLSRSIELKKNGRDREAMRLVLTNEGKTAMDEIRKLTATMASHEETLLHNRQAKADSHARFSHHLALSLMLLDTIALISIVTMLKRMQSLNRIVTVCAWSKTIKSGGRWISFESYLQEQFGISVSHGMSKEVYNKLMSETDQAADARPPKHP